MTIQSTTKASVLYIIFKFDKSTLFIFNKTCQYLLSFTNDHQISPIKNGSGSADLWRSFDIFEGSFLNHLWGDINQIKTSYPT